MNTKPISLPVHGLTGYALAGSRPDSKSRKPEEKGREKQKHYCCPPFIYKE